VVAVAIGEDVMEVEGAAHLHQIVEVAEAVLHVVGVAELVGARSVEEGGPPEEQRRRERVETAMGGGRSRGEKQDQ